MKQRNSGLPILQRDEGVHTFTQNRAGLGYNRTFENARKVQQNVLDFGGINLEASSIDQVFLTIRDVNEPIRIN